MTFLHLSDLHFGKNLHGLNLAASGDQAQMVEDILHSCDEIKPDAVLLCGDIYDRSQPSQEARSLCSRFLTALCARHIPILMIAGNHDAPENIEYLQELLAHQGLFVSGVLHPTLRKITLEDAFGPVDFYLLPYFFPARVGQVLGEDTPASYTEAARRMLACQNVDFSRRCVLLAHQFVCKGASQPQMDGSESTVGGVGQLDVSALDGFDYAALGHIHKPQIMGRDTVRYAGSPLCYHFGEAGAEGHGNETRQLLYVTLKEKGAPVQFRRVPLQPAHPLVNRTGTLDAVVRDELASPTPGAYVHVRLTDPLIPPDAQSRLDAVFASHGSRLLLLDRQLPRHVAPTDTEKPRPIQTLPEMFLSYYTSQYPNLPIAPEEQKLVFMAARILEEEGMDEDTLDQSAAHLLNIFLTEEDMPS